MWLRFGMMIKAKILYNHIYGKIDLVAFPKRMSKRDLKLNFKIAPPMIMLFTRSGDFSAMVRIKIVPKEIPIKCEDLIFS